MSMYVFMLVLKVITIHKNVYLAEFLQGLFYCFQDSVILQKENYKYQLEHFNGCGKIMFLPSLLNLEWHCCIVQKVTFLTSICRGRHSLPVLRLNSLAD